jgi:hypothetical protein
MAARSLKQARHEYERALTAVYGLLIHCGVRQRAISTMTRRAFKAAVAKSHVSRESGGGELTTLALVLDAWHRDRRYLTSKGKPKAVPLLGRTRSVEALIRTQGGQLDAVELAHRIRSLQLIEPCTGNRYRPIGDAAVVSRYGPTVLQYVARCLMSLLGTVEHNLRSGPDMPSLLERTAEVPTLPLSSIESFRHFSRSQGSALTRTINDWLETRRIRGAVANPKKVVRAGVHLFVYISPIKSRSRVSTSSKS